MHSCRCMVTEVIDPANSFALMHQFVLHTRRVESAVASCSRASEILQRSLPAVTASSDRCSTPAWQTSAQYLSVRVRSRSSFSRRRKAVPAFPGRDTRTGGISRAMAAMELQACIGFHLHMAKAHGDFLHAAAQPCAGDVALFKTLVYANRCIQLRHRSSAKPSQCPHQSPGAIGGILCTLATPVETRECHACI